MGIAGSIAVILVLLCSRSSGRPESADEGLRAACTCLEALSALLRTGERTRRRRVEQPARGLPTMDAGGGQVARVGPGQRGRDGVRLALTRHEQPDLLGGVDRREAQA